MANEQFPFSYSPIIDREFDLPGDNKIAVWVIINIEHDLTDEPVSTPLYEGTSGYTPDVFNYGWRDYGLRVGVWRLMDIFDKHEISATIALNAAVCDHEPQIINAILERDWEIIGHGRTNAERLTDMNEEAEREVIQDTRRRIETATGSAPIGWLGPGLTETFNTPNLLAEEGFEYVADWTNDDQPYGMNVGSGDLISIPYSTALNDVTMFVKHGASPSEYEKSLKDQFSVLYQEGKQRGNKRVMAIPLHPYIVGQPYCSMYLENVLQFISDRRDVWITSGGEIARHYYENYHGDFV